MNIHVHFSEVNYYHIVPHKSDSQCIQQYYEDYAVCQKQFIEHTYIQQHGSLIGFNYTIALQTHKKLENILEQELFPEEEEEEEELKKKK